MPCMLVTRNSARSTMNHWGSVSTFRRNKRQVDRIALRQARPLWESGRVQVPNGDVAQAVLLRPTNGQAQRHLGDPVYVPLPDDVVEVAEQRFPAPVAVDDRG